MPVELSPGPAISTFLIHDGSRLGTFEAAAGRPILQEEPNGEMLPPAGASRADAVFTIVGVALLLILAFSFLWTLLRQRRR
jgi:hypothetical protein